MYEVLITTGIGDKAGTDKHISFSLIYGGGQTSKPFYPGGESNHGDAYQAGQLDLCRDCDFEDQSGASLNIEGITAVDIDFPGERWLLNKVWITNVDTGYTVSSDGPIWIGSETENKSPYRLPLKQETSLDATHGKSAFFDLTVKTVAASDDHKDPGTDNTVHFKLFGADGRSSECHRARRRGDQYEAGATDNIRGFFTSHWFKGFKIIDDGHHHIDMDVDSEPFRINTRIFKILIVKEGGDSWRPEWLEVTPSRGQQPTNHFRVKEQMPDGSDGSLEGDYKWCCVTADPLE